MATDQRIPAAQYLRMSTEHQQYSLENQSARIRIYAQTHGFTVVQTYTDSARTGVVLRRRPGLQNLLQDVVGRAFGFQAILVYDVSRWGRFQDGDEAAHYEFLCKSSGIPVHYCAEPFSNDGSLAASVMKALKRSMAAEYSRELGVKVLDGQKRLARLGFKQGGKPGYGLRRMLLGRAGTPKQPLGEGDRKCLATDRVILVPGPEEEVKVVRTIYRMLVTEDRTVYAIARLLNARRVPYVAGSEWDYRAVYSILTNPKYAGCHVFGRTSSRLYTRTVKQPPSEWIRTPRAFQPIIDAETFDQAQRLLHTRTINRTDQDILEILRALLTEKGRLSLSLIQETAGLPSPSTYRKRFGSLRRAYELVGYTRPEDFSRVDSRTCTRFLRERLLEQIVELSSGRASIQAGPNGRWRTRLRLTSGITISVMVAKAVRTWKQTIGWRVNPARQELGLAVLLARLAVDNRSFLDYHILPATRRNTRFAISEHDPWLRQGRKLHDLQQVLQEIMAQQHVTT